MNKSVKSARENTISLAITELDFKSHRGIDLSDFTFSNNRDVSTQLGDTFFRGDHGCAVSIRLMFYKFRRVVLSELAVLHHRL